MTIFGAHFGDEVIAAGLGGLPFSWSDDGTVFGRENLTSEQNMALDAVVAEHDPDAAISQLQPLTARQLRLGLVGGDIMPAQVDAAIAAIPDDTDRAVAEIEWEYATQFERDHPLIEQVGTALGLTPEQIDAMWQAALEL